MGSATPSVEAWHLMKDKKIQTHYLTKRLAGGCPPEIQIVNLSKPTPDGRKTEGSISPQLEDEIRQTLQERRQTILFLNRRGFSHFFKCSSCGHELKCKNCSVSMTYHKVQKKLICHYCGWNINPPTQCPECNSFDVGYFGFGTEFIEEEVKAKFPNATVARIDTDSLSSPKELQEKVANGLMTRAEALCETAVLEAAIFEKYNFDQYVVSMKSSDVKETIESNRFYAQKFNNPLHLGVTEAGDAEDGRIKSAVGIGALLADGIGDTLRVSLAEAPENEIPVAKELVDYIAVRAGHAVIDAQPYEGFNYEEPVRRTTVSVGVVGGDAGKTVKKSSVNF